MSDLLRLRRLAEGMSDQAVADPLRWVHWTPPQDDWLGRHARRKLLRAGNQLGKTWAGMAEVIMRCMGVHTHYAVRAPPIEAWVVCTSWSQSVAIMRKFWDLVPRAALRPGVRFDPRHGFGRDSPAVVFRNGSIVRFRTTNQGPEALAGATVDYVAIDEPTDADIYRELDRRVMRRSGTIGITLTPINRPCGWLRQLVGEGIVEEVHAALTVPNLTVLGAREPLRLLDGTPMDAAWIADQRRITPAAWAPVVLDGEWETRPQGVFFTCFDANKHVSSRVTLDPRRGPIRTVLGLDYAAADRPYGHCAALLQVQEQQHQGRSRFVVYAIDEVVLPGAATNPHFARELLNMLGRQKLRWSDLYAVHGDNPVESRFHERSNAVTMRSVAIEMSIPNDAVIPRIRSAKQGHESSPGYNQGNQWIYERIASNEYMVHPRCEALIRGFETWDYSKMHPSKDCLDSARYGLLPFIFAHGAPDGPGVVVRLY